MKRLSLSPEHLRVESFHTGVVPSAGGTLVVSTWPIRTRPECANTVYDTCDC